MAETSKKPAREAPACAEGRQVAEGFAFRYRENVTDEDELQGNATASQDQKIELLLKENKWLKERIEHLETELSEKDKRHDTIVLTMTQQLEKKRAHARGYEKARDRAKG